MIIRTALSQDAAELTEFNIDMARETEGYGVNPRGNWRRCQSHDRESANGILPGGRT